ncbi:DUF982 domain-containing protein [Pseudaminobacter arsenicus]|uniref:DUF982 domain-containing protein n=1 Tax=Borborobacter arsenicus TaxID=1851146 RepID=A0A432V0Y8_9HYPH|nr:DUF982 domain-containing protein [Pseudaminobacter arsenicus]
MQSEKWPTRSGPFMQIAKDALYGAKSGHVTPAEARRAFADAAMEARTLSRVMESADIMAFPRHCE